MPANLHFLVGALEASYRIKTATNGADALELARSADKPNLILLDVMMPGMNGIDVMTQLKESEVTRDIPVIFVSADRSEQSQLDGLELGADDYLIKPVMATVLRARVHNLLQRVLAETELRRTAAALSEANERFRNLNATLEQRVQQRTAELTATEATLQRSQEELVRSSAQATLSTLVASVSHELGTPIGNSVLAAGVLTKQTMSFEERVAAGLVKRSDLSHYISTMREGTDLLERNLTRAGNLLRHFKMIAADQASERRRPFELGLTVNEVIDTMKPTLRQHVHRIVVDIPESIRLDSYPGPLGQVIINLVNNAYLHAFDGRRDGELKILAVQEGGRVRLTVADNGIGISEENVKRMFQPFFSTKIGEGGTGLGMSIVENLVTDVLGGSVSVKSQEGVGTSVELDIPMIAPEAGNDSPR
jgi:signal transduction histidine kinase